MGQKENLVSRWYRPGSAKGSALGGTKRETTAIDTLISGNCAKLNTLPNWVIASVVCRGHSPLILSLVSLRNASPNMYSSPQNPLSCPQNFRWNALSTTVARPVALRPGNTTISAAMVPELLYYHSHHQSAKFLLPVGENDISDGT